MPAKSSVSCVRRAPTGGFTSRYTSISTEGRGGPAAGFDAKMDFGILRLPGKVLHSETTKKESLWVLLRGAATVTAGGKTARLARSSLFDEGPSAVHAGIGEMITIQSSVSSEWAVTRTTNPREIGSRIYLPAETATEDRGYGLAQNACRRLVRTIFDYSSRPESNLVAGEVVNYPGRWSTYPPHHHPQPEIYHYRFTEPQGYGHSEIGENVYKVRSGDTVKIPGGLDHAQVSAPGYGMYYLWVIRHLTRTPYKGFEFTAEHKWLLDPQKQGWAPANLAK